MVESDSSSDNDEIDLIELINILVREWKTIFGIMLLCTAIALAYALYSKEIFKAETLIAPAQEEKTKSSSALNGFGGLAAMAGISIPSDSNIEQVIATLQSRKFLGAFVRKNNLLPTLFQSLWDAKNKKWLVETDEDEPTEQKAVAAFKSILAVVEDKKTGLITVSIEWGNPSTAAEWANLLVDQLNEQLREEAIADSQKRVGYLEEELAKTTLQDMRAVLYNLLEAEKQKAMLANVNEDFALEVIDPAVAPETHEKPKRKLIVAIGGVCGVFLGMFAVFFSNFLKKVTSSKSFENAES